MLIFFRIFRIKNQKIPKMSKNPKNVTAFLKKYVEFFQIFPIKNQKISKMSKNPKIFTVFYGEIFWIF